MDLGFDGASMNEIARSAGVSKGTLYVYFADKNRLFEAIVEEEAFEQGKSGVQPRPCARCRDHAAGVRPEPIWSCFAGRAAGRAIRTVMAIAERMPDVGRRYYANVLEKAVNRLADYLRAHVGPGDLAIDDCQLAASQFMEVCKASLFLPFVFQAAPAPSPERIDEVVDSATRMFLAAYRAT